MWKHEFTGNEITDNQYQALTSYNKRNYYRVAQPVVNQQEDEDLVLSVGLDAVVEAFTNSSEDNLDTSSNDSSDFGGFGGGDSGGAGASADF